MNQKIEGILSAGPRQIHPSIERRIACAGSEHEQSATAIRASDSLRLTGEAVGLQVLQRELTAAPAIDSARIQTVREALESGNYTINPEQIAARMLELDAQLGGA